LGLSAFGIEGTVIPTPGHTEGSISVILPRGEAIAGDLLMGGFLFRKLAETSPFCNIMKISGSRALR
jgi:glyoxylase-like metal-dependent hydrolase (beta-lactamase superfamily II)